MILYHFINLKACVVYLFAIEYTVLKVDVLLSCFYLISISLFGKQYELINLFELSKHKDSLLDFFSTFVFSFSDVCGSDCKSLFAVR